MKCIQCGRELPDGAKFCGFCGTRQDVKGPLGQEVRQEDRRDTVVPEETKRQDKLREKKAEDKSKETKKKNPALIAVAVALIAALAVGGIFLAGRFKKPKDEVYIAYMKDGQILEKKVSDLKADPVVLGDYNEMFQNKYRSSGSVMGYSQDGKYLYYGKNFVGKTDDYDCSYTLMRRPAHEEGEGEEIAEKVKSFDLYDSHLFYLTTDGDFFILKEDEKKQLASGMSQMPYYYHEKGLIWQENEVEKKEEEGYSTDKTYDLAILEYPFDGEKEIVLTGISSNQVRYQSDDKEGDILAWKDGDLYYKAWGKEPVTIAEDVEKEFEMDGKGAVYYIKKGEGTLDYSSLVDDPYKEKDKKQPEITDWEKWQAWFKRDLIRSELKSLKSEDNMVLYSYLDGKETKITDYYESYSLTAMDTDAAVYSSHDPEKMKKVSMDDLVSKDESLWKAFDTQWDNALTTWILSGGKTRSLFDGEAGYARADKKKKTGYVEKYGENFDFKTLYSFDLSKNASGEAEKIAENVTDYSLQDTTVYYMTGTEANDQRTLYREGKKVDTNVKEFLYLGWNNNQSYLKHDGKLCIDDGKESQVLVDGYYASGYLKGGEMVFHDYDSASGKGTLSYVDEDGKLTEIDTGVSDFMHAGSFNK